MNYLVDDDMQKALTSKDVSAVKKLVDSSEKVLVDQMIENKWALLDVINVGRADLTKLFLDSHGSIVVDDPEHGGAANVLHTAVDNLDVGHVKLLLDRNADPNRSLDAYFPSSPLSHLHPRLHQSRDDAVLDVLKMLLDRGANITRSTNFGNELKIFDILANGSAEAVQLVLDTNVNLRERFIPASYTVAHFLAMNGRPGVWEAMRDRDFDVNARNEIQETPLFLAAHYGIVDAVELMLRFENVDVNAADEEIGAPIHAAARNYDSDRERYEECILLLLLHGADVQVASVDDDVPTVFDREDESGYTLEPCNYALAQIFLEHLALKQALGTPITELIRSKIESESQYKEYFDSCKLRLKAKVYGSDALFTLLTCDEEKLVPYMRNEELVETLQSYLESIGGEVYYSRLLRDRIKRASETAKLRDSAAVVIGKLMGINHADHSLIMGIIVTYLKNQDLNTLLNMDL